MKIVTTLVGIMDHHRGLEWPTGWPVPSEGDSVDLPNLDESPLYVRTVVWYPEGDSDSSDEPFVYLVLGPDRR